MLQTLSPIHPTRAALLTAARQAFAERGIDGATVAEIRRAAGASNGSFFHFFPTKDALAAALFLEALGTYHQALLAPLAANPDAAEGIGALVEAHLDWVVEERDQARLLFDQARPEWHAQIRDELAAETANFEEVLNAWRRPWIKAGSLRPLPIPLFLAQVVGPAQILTSTWLAGRSAGDPRTQRATLARCAVQALAPMQRQAAPA